MSTLTWAAFFSYNVKFSNSLFVNEVYAQSKEKCRKNKIKEC